MIIIITIIIIVIIIVIMSNLHLASSSHIFRHMSRFSRVVVTRATSGKYALYTNVQATPVSATR